MGKDKSGQRTKGNQKPSSSGRSAELLGGANGFVGFGGLSDICYVPAASQATSDDDSQISSEFRVALRKMSKKDSVTKIKALQEYESLCVTENIESLKTTLPFWPRLYGKLSFDHERRVREATQTAHAALVAKVGKSLAPHLRLIMPVWLLAMADPHPPTASAAKRVFHNAFSEEKRPGVMIFCLKEIMEYITDIMIIQSPQTLSDPETTAEEDQESKYVRALYCSFKGISIFLNIVASLDDKKSSVSEKIGLLLEQDKFWKHSKYKNPLVRNAWFTAIKSLLEYENDALLKYNEVLTQNIFSALDEPDPTVLPHIWIAFLHLCDGMPSCWDHCGKPEAVFNRILSVLRAGGRGCAAELHPQLLPILSVFPDRILPDKTNHIIDFFRAISTSLRKVQILLKRRESSAIITALFECLKYESIHECSNAELWSVLIRFQMVDLVVSSINDTPLLSKTNLYQEVAKLLYFWSSKSERRTGDQIDFSRQFWELFLPECDAWLLQGDETKLCKLETLFHSIRDPFTAINQSRGVTFAVVPIKKDTITPSEVVTTDAISDAIREKYLSSTGDFVSGFTQRCFESFQRDKKSSIFELFSSLFLSFSSTAMLRNLLEGESALKEEVEQEENIQVRFLDEVLLPLMEMEDTPENSSIDIFMHLHSKLRVETRRNILFNLKSTVSIGCLRILVQKMAKRMIDVVDDDAAPFWLKSPQLGCRLVSATQQLCAISVTQTQATCESLKNYKELLLLVEFALRNGDNEKDVIFSQEYLNQMVKAMRSATSQLTETPISSEGASSFLQNGLSRCVIQLLENVVVSPFCWDIDGMNEILCSLFHVVCLVDRADIDRFERLKALIITSFEAYSSNALNCGEVKNLFTEGYFNLILQRAKKIVTAEGTSYQTTFNTLTLIEKVIFIAKNSGSTEEKEEDCEIVLDHSSVQDAMNALIPTEAEWCALEDTLSPLYVAPPILLGWFYPREFPIARTPTETPGWDQRYIRTCLFLLELLNTFCVPATGSGEKDAENEAISLGPYTRLAALCLHATSHATVMKQLNLQLNYNLITDDIETGINRIDCKMQSLLSKMNIGNKKLVVKIIRDRCMDGSSLWCTTLRFILMKWIKLSSEAFTVVIELDENALGATSTKQTLIGYMNEESCLRRVLEEETSKLTDFSEDPYSAISPLVLLTSTLEHLPSKFSKNAVDAVFKCFIEWRELSDNIFLFATDLSGIAWEEVSMIVNIIHFISVSVRLHSTHLTFLHWDFILCSVSAWVQSLQEVVKPVPEDAVLSMFVCATTRCVYHVSKFMKIPFAEDGEGEKREFLPSLQEEWREFFSPSINSIVFRNFVLCCDSYNKNPNIVLHEVCQSLSMAVHPLTSDELKELNLPPLFNAEDEDAELKLPDKYQTLLSHVTPLLLCRHASAQSTAFCILNSILPDVMSHWDGNEVALSENEDLPQRSLPYDIGRVMLSSECVVDTLLSDKDPGSACEVKPHTDSFTYCIGYLMAWKVSLMALSIASASTQSLYSTFLRESGHLNKLLSHLSKLLPQSPHFTNSSQKKGTNMFTSKLNLFPDHIPTSDTAFWLTCQVYLSCLTQLPAAVRIWWTNVDRSTQQLVDKFTSSYVSPVIIQSELSKISDSNVKFENMTVKARLGAREVIAIYTIDEASMELVLRLAPNHPLSIVTLEDHKRVGVSLAEWRNWLFGLNSLLSYRNTSLLDSLAFWKRNLDQKFQGLEECCICYYVLHSTNNQIPKLVCKTCKKKFHPSCLYTWFNTSNKSTCPICRSLF